MAKLPNGALFVVLGQAMLKLYKNVNKAIPPEMSALEVSLITQKSPLESIYGKYSFSRKSKMATVTSRIILKPS